MANKDFSGIAKMTPKYGKCEPIFIKGHFKYNEAKNAYVVKDAIPHCYAGIYLNADIIEKVN